MTTGFIVLLFAVSLGIISFGGVLSLLLSFIGVLAGTGLIFAGVVRMADPEVFGRARALASFLRRNLAVVGLGMASSAVTAASGEPGQLSWFGMLLVLLLGVSLINVGVLGQ